LRSFERELGKGTKQKRPATAGSVIAANRRAHFNYEVLERFEAGITLAGSEVKSIRDGKISLAESFAQFVGNELFLVGAHIAEYPQAHERNHDPLRRRKLLLHRRELDQLERAVSRQGLTLVPLAMYLKSGKIKLELGLCRGKQAHDKRATLKKREQQREIDRELRTRK
jgi:SsrA-binding protein